MEKIKKLLPIILLSVVLIAVLVYAQRFEEEDKNRILAFSVCSENGTIETVWAWNDEESFYVFLPSYADLTDVKAEINNSYDIEIEGTSLTDKTDLSRFSVGQQYRMKTKRRNSTQDYNIQFLKSSNVGTLFIDTQTGNMKSVNKDKNNKETVETSLFDKDGVLNYNGEKDSIRGRGNTTWEFFEKKPYLLTLSSPVSLLGMSESNKWVLLANATDGTCLKSKLIFDFAAETGLKATPGCEYVDLYLNGEYAGLYLLCEKVETIYNEMDSSGGDSDFLCVLDNRNETYRTNAGQNIEIIYPDNFSSQQESDALSQVQKMEDSFKSGEQLSTIIDMDSWVKRYLIEEIFENVDSSRYSSYFYALSRDNTIKFYAGPLWDVDLTWGADKGADNPNTFVANEEWRSQRESDYHPWYHWLYQNDEFRQSIINTYSDELKPYLYELVNSEIDNTAEQISNAVNCNNVRWKKNSKDPNELKEFLQKRVEFLDSVWIDKEEYAFIQIEYGYRGEYLNYSVKKGTVFSGISEKYTANLDNPVWIDKDTGEVFDFSSPITKDTTLIMILSSGDNNKSEGIVQKLFDYVKLYKEMMLNFAYIMLLGFFFVCLVWVDFRRNKSRRNE